MTYVLFREISLKTSYGPNFIRNHALETLHSLRKSKLQSLLEQIYLNELQ